MAATSNPWAGMTISKRTAQITAELRAKSAAGEAETAYLGLTDAGREFMALVGAGHFDFFDDGIVEHSGNWGENLAAQAAPAMGREWRSMSGIMNGTKKAGLWNTGEDGGQIWWALTALGAAVALLAAGRTTGQPGEMGAWELQPKQAQPADTRTYKELVTALRAKGYTGPVSYTKPRLLEIVKEVGA